MDAGTYTATMKSLSGTEASNYKLPDPAPSQDYVLSKAASSMTFTPGSISTTYSLTASQGNSFAEATDASPLGTVTYSITGGDTEGFSIPTAAVAKIDAVAKKAAKTSYSIKITAHDSGDKNHEEKDVEDTLA